MQSRRAVLTLAGLLLAASLAPAAAGETRPFSDPAFEAAQKSGKPILVEVSAPWCPICKTQKPILAKLSSGSRAFWRRRSDRQGRPSGSVHSPPGISLSAPTI